MTTAPNTPTPLAVTRWSGLSPLGVFITRCEVALAGLFLFAAYHKLWGANAPQNFSHSVKAFNVTTDELGLRLATSVTPWVEVVAATLLLLGIWVRAAAWTLAMMLVMFIILILRAIMNGYDLECGCFGDLSPFCPKKVGPCNVIQNTILLGMALLIALTPRRLLARRTDAA